MRLYHGSKNGIRGEIAPISRKTCDFGRGFYLGDKELQPKGLIAGYGNSHFYVMDFEPEGLSVRQFGDTYEEQMDWALYIAYNRRVIDFSTLPILREKYEHYNHSYDVIIGLIANDKMTQVLNRFYSGGLCDKAMLDALQRVKLGSQYVLKTQKACQPEHIRIAEEKELTLAERKSLIVENEQRVLQMGGLLEQLQVRYRRAADVKYFDEILKE